MCTISDLHRNKKIKNNWNILNYTLDERDWLACFCRFISLDLPFWSACIAVVTAATARPITAMEKKYIFLFDTNQLKRKLSVSLFGIFFFANINKCSHLAFPPIRRCRRHTNYQTKLSFLCVFFSFFFYSSDGCIVLSTQNTHTLTYAMQEKNDTKKIIVLLCPSQWKIQKKMIFRSRSPFVLFLIASKIKSPHTKPLVISYLSNRNRCGNLIYYRQPKIEQFFSMCVMCISCRPNNQLTNQQKKKKKTTYKYVDANAMLENFFCATRIVWESRNLTIILCMCVWFFRGHA